MNFVLRHATRAGGPFHASRILHICKSGSAAGCKCASVLGGGGRRAVASAGGAAGGGDLSRSVRPIPIQIITVTKGRSVQQDAATEWSAKLARYTQLTEVTVKPNPRNAKDTAVAQAHEAERVMKAIQPGDHVVLLDERGKDVSSEDLARLLARASDRSWPRLVFAIGGPFGHGQEVRDRADESIRLSRMVLNHQVAHIVLVEQLYRAWTILRGEPYHH